MRKYTVDATKQLLSRRPKSPAENFGCEIVLRSVQVSNITERSADLRCEIAALLYERLEAGKDLAGTPTFIDVHYQFIAWPQSKTLLKGSNRWYLTSGTLDGPKT
jgi:hypothetical protein